ncbi:HAD hydrolase-like protein [Lentzea sp. BCCO 10_0061]|uniref:HAD hydrolase-like protein n=1 Tax=Lentzea sokolovensis TaxID=3095429 RepID=A0ABU4UYX8_9PSEU|nr:HAD family hydrolase [Lentzea sp. BCCO 10_0061]MDX8143943.1 HAD hydrolase-like protein [Lentzea sp. BCCO 10_0061]
MKDNRVRLNDIEALRKLFIGTKALLLDFDGPICDVFAGFPASVVADQLRGILADEGHGELPSDIRTTRDPFDVLKCASRIGRDEARYVEAALRAHEVEAARSAKPTPGAHELIRAFRKTGRTIAVVSNNSAAAIEAYLGIWDLQREVNLVSARTQPEPDLLKPSPHLLIEAVAGISADVRACTFIGDSVTDIQAANSISMPVVGFANKIGKLEEFRALHPAAIVTQIETLTDLAR